jgi:hypothetical protein
MTAWAAGSIGPRGKRRSQSTAQPVHTALTS